MTYLITYTQGSGPNSQTIRGCSSEAEALAQFWSQSYIKNNSKTVVVSVRATP